MNMNVTLSYCHNQLFKKNNDTLMVVLHSGRSIICNQAKFLQILHVFQGVQKTPILHVKSQFNFTVYLR